MTHDDVEQLVRKFCGCLSGNVRLDVPRKSSGSSISIRSDNGCEELPWISVRFDDDFTRSSDDGARRRSVREKLEAVSVLSAVACCRAFALQRNTRFWTRLLERDCDVHTTELLTRALGSDSACDIMPMFLLDFSFMTISSDDLELCRAFLTAKRSVKRCPRKRFRAAMMQLEAIAKQDGAQPKTVRVGFVFNRCRFQASRESDSSTSSDYRGTEDDSGGGSTETSANRSSVRTPDLPVMQQVHELVHAVAARAFALDALRVSARSSSTDPPTKIADVDRGTWDVVVFDVASLEVSASALVKQDVTRMAQIVADPLGRLCVLVLINIVSSARGATDVAALGALLTACFRVARTSATSDMAAARALSDSAVSSSSASVALSSPAAAAVVTRSTQQRFTLERFVFDWNALNVSSVSALFSAIASSSRAQQSVAELSLVGSLRRFDGDATLPWAWLAFGLFHAASASRIRALDLSSNTLCLDDVHAMQRVLAMDNCYAELLGMRVVNTETNRVPPTAAAAAVQRLRVARLKRTAQLLPARDAPTSAALQLPDVERAWFEVFVRTKRWTCVLVPGYGVLWVRSKHIAAVEARDRAVVHKQHPLRTLVLHAMVGKESEQMDRVLCALLPLVSASLVRLELCSNPLTNAALAVAMRACPLLTHLDVTDCELPTIAAILDAYERGQCRLESLAVAENGIRERDVRRLCAMLRPRSSSRGCTAATAVSTAAAQCLRWLDLDQNPIGRHGLLAVGKMLAVNQVLQYIVLCRSEDPDGQLRSRYAVHNDEDLGVQPLQRRQRLAVLSVARAIPAIDAIDAPVLSTIFAFAAMRVVRTVVWK